MRRVLVWSIVLVFVLASLWLTFPLLRSKKASSLITEEEALLGARMRILSVGDSSLVVEIAETPEAWARGLSHRTSLPPERGMLFLFPARAPRTFWMKDTLLPLDLLWIRDDRIVGITANVPPEPGVPDEALRRYPSPGPVDAVLETNGGWAVQHSVHGGDQVVVH